MSEKKITPRRIVHALKCHRMPGDPVDSYPMSRKRLAVVLGLTTKAHHEELGRVLKKMWPREFKKWGVFYGYYPTGWRVRLKVSP